MFHGHSNGDFIFALAGDGVAGSNIDLFSIRNNNTGVVHLNTVNGARMALGASSTGAGSVVETLTLLPSGFVGIGTTNPSTALDIIAASNNAYGLLKLRSSNSNNAGITFWTGGDDTMRNWQISNNYVTSGGLSFMRSTSNTGNPTTPVMEFDVSGNVGIGTQNPTQKLSVAGTIRAYAVVVDTGWSDYVFDDNYRLAPLSEVESHIKAEKHLPGIPSAAEVAEHGVSLGDMQSKLLAKVEELTLHLIAQEKEIAALKNQNSVFEKQLGGLRTPVTYP
jgi:hypothetical protein